MILQGLRERFAWLACCAISTGCVGCSVDGGDDSDAWSDGSTDAGVETDVAVAAPPTLTWVLDWSTEGVEQSVDGWSVTTEDGTTLEVTDGALVTYGGQLIECATAARVSEDVLVRVARAAQELLVGRAWAGHSGDSSNATTIEGVIEPLTPLSTSTWGRAGLAPTRYCRAHYLVARGDESVRGWSERPEMDRTTLRMAGSWRRRDAGGSFAFESAIANGAFLGLTPDGTGIDGAAGSWTITVRRDVRTWLSSVDWQEPDASRLGDAVVMALLAATTAEVVAD